MKLSKTTLLLVGIGIFVIAGAGLGMMLSQQASKQESLSAQLAQALTNVEVVKLEKLHLRIDELQTELDQATTQFAAVTSVLSQPIGSAGVTSTLFDTASTSNVSITAMTTSERATEIFEEGAYTVVSATARVEGGVPDLVDFIVKLNERFLTGVITSATMTVLEANGAEPSSANIQMSVYATTEEE